MLQHNLFLGGSMDFLELVEKRYSVRAYRSTPVEDEKLNRVLEAMRLAPTACNLQPFQFLVIQTKGREEELRRIYRPSWFVQAPIVICACGIPSRSWSRRDGKNYCDVDVTIAMDHLILAAAEVGLGTCWVGAFNPEEARKILGLPEDAEPLAFTPLGYPDDQPGPKRRKAIQKLVRYEHW
jgi:nitroreductase